MDLASNMGSALVWLTYVSLAMYIGPVTLVGIYWSWSQGITDSDFTTGAHWYDSFVHPHKTHGIAQAA